jgi:hypothetical protein
MPHKGSLLSLSLYLSDLVVHWPFPLSLFSWTTEPFPWSCRFSVCTAMETLSLDSHQIASSTHYCLPTPLTRLQTLSGLYLCLTYLCGSGMVNTSSVNKFVIRGTPHRERLWLLQWYWNWSFGPQATCQVWPVAPINKETEKGGLRKEIYYPAQDTPWEEAK